MTRYEHRHTVLRALDLMTSGDHDAGSDLLGAMDQRDGLAAAVTIIRDLLAREAERSNTTSADVLLRLHVHDETNQMEDHDDDEQG